MSINRINTNFDAMFARNSLQKLELEISKSTQRLATGKKIITAGDDPQGVSKLATATAQLRGNMVAAQNIQETLEFLKYYDSAMQMVEDKLLYVRDIAMKQANDATLSAAQLTANATEYTTVMSSFNAAAEAGYTWNGKAVLTALAASAFQIGPNAADTTAMAALTAKDSATLNTTAAIGTATLARTALGTIDTGLTTLSTSRALAGTQMALLDLQLNAQFNMQNANAGTVATIGDADMAAEVSALASNQILAQASTAMLGQANLQSQMLVQLLGNL